MRALTVVALVAGCASVPKPLPVAEPPVAPGPPTCPASLPAFSEDAPAPGARVEKVCLVGASEDGYLKLHELVAPREGSPLSAAEVQADIEHLFATATVSDVVVLAEPLPSKGVMLIYAVNEFDRIAEVSVTGTKALAADDVRQVIVKGLPASPLVLTTVSNKLKELYAALGYPRAKVSLASKRTAPGSAAVSLEVEEGPQLTFGAVTFEGPKRVPAAELRALLRSKTGAPFAQSQVEQDEQALSALYFDRGMVNAKVETKTRDDGASVAVVFVVTEGDLFRVGKLTLSGFSLGAPAEVLKGLETKPKSTFSRAAIRRDLDRLRRVAHDRGATVNVTPLTSIDADKKLIDLDFEVEQLPGGDKRF